MIILPRLAILCLITIFLSIFTYTDIKTKTVSPFLIATMVAMSFFISIVFGYEIDMWQLAIGCVMGIIPYLIMAFMNKGGGADALLMGGLGFILGFPNILYLILIISAVYCVFGILYFVFCKSHQKISEIRFPYAPFVLCGWVIFILLGIFL